jgi:hypothetical protein
MVLQKNYIEILFFMLHKKYRISIKYDNDIIEFLIKLKSTNYLIILTFEGRLDLSFTLHYLFATDRN